MITQLLVRIKRDDDWQSIEINQLTDDEIESYFKRYPDSGCRWAIVLAKWIRANIKEK